jgi:iron complex transport system permease protein
MGKKLTGWFLFLGAVLLLVVAAALFSITRGELNIPLSSLPGLFGDETSVEALVMFQIRWPRTLLAFAIGGALGLSGAILQGIYRNPLVEPYTLGISGGAAFFVALTIVTGIHQSVGIIMLPMAGFSGALLTIFLVYFLSFRKGGIDINRMLLIGVMISFVASSSMMFLMSVTTAENIHGIIFWVMGSLDEPNQTLIYLMVAVSVGGLFIAYLFARPLNALRLGQTKAMHLGVKSSTSIRILFVVASLLAGICVSVAGVIGFVGLVIPHLVRLLVGSDSRVLLLGSFLGGSLFLILSDVMARTIIAPNELPIGVITGMVGGVIFMVVLSRLRKNPKLD